MKPSLLFESADLHALHERLAAVTEITSPINTQPFPHFNFANPSGHYFQLEESNNKKALCLLAESSCFLARW